MRNVLGLGLSLVLAAGGSVSAQSPGIRDVTASERNLVTLNTKLRFTTMVVLPTGEEIVDVICGDRDFWVISATHNIAHVKPAKESAQTNLNLVASSGAIYSFMLQEGKPGAVPDLKVYVTGGEMAERAAASAKPKYYTAAEMDALEAEVRRAQDTADAAQKVAQRNITDAAARLPLTLAFDYEPLPYAKPFLIRAVFSDGRFTYVKTDARELPALYEMKDGKPALVNFQTPEPGTYVIPKVLESGYFVLGERRLPFKARAHRGE